MQDDLAARATADPPWEAAPDRARDHADFLSVDQMARRWDIAPTAIKTAIEDQHLKARVVGKTQLVEYGDAVAWIKTHKFKEKKPKNDSTTTANSNTPKASGNA